jgi:REP element-mobilizing transposase RayT
MPSKKITTAIEPGAIYHIYNRGNNFQKVFLRESDYSLFLEKFKHYMLKVCSLYAFVLIPNHYHLLLRINDNIEGIMFSNQFSKFMLSYTNFINRRDRRNGSLFLCRFRRIKIENDDYLKRLVFYINHNPVKHKITKDYKTYKYSSYQILISDSPTKLSRDEVLQWFDGKAGLIEFHSVLHDNACNSKFSLE